MYSFRENESTIFIIMYLLVYFKFCFQFRMLGKNIDQAKRYIVAFWNGVDLRYRALTKPKVRLNIAGIIVGMVCIYKTEILQKKAYT